MAKPGTRVGGPTTPKKDALDALASARKIVDSPESWVHEIQVGQLRFLLEYAERKVEAIEELKRARANRKAVAHE